MALQAVEIRTLRDTETRTRNVTETDFIVEEPRRINDMNFPSQLQEGRFQGFISLLSRFHPRRRKR